MYVPGRKASKLLGLHQNTLRRYADNGKIEYIRNGAGQRRYNVQSYIHGKSAPVTVCYCRVSSYKQKDDLARQIVYMQEQFPNAEIIKDIGSALNYKRKGLQTILDRLLCGAKLTLIVAYRDRLCRFGYELFKYLIEANGGQLLVLNDDTSSPEQEFTRDLLSILHVFSCRMYGLQKYVDQIKKDKTLSNCSAKTLV